MSLPRLYNRQSSHGPSNAGNCLRFSKNSMIADNFSLFKVLKISSKQSKCILTSSDNDLFLRVTGGGGVSESQDSFTCPLCGQYGFKAHDLKQHIT